ncbi:MAG: SUMF1/EgtB/PvdO family nonheme iron enzyme [Bacteroidota bacterium]
MKIFKNAVIAIAMLLSIAGLANNIQIADIQFNRNKGTVDFQLSWENCWKNDKNHDAAWVFVKLLPSDGGYIHGNLAASGHNASGKSGAKARLHLPNDKVGLFVAAKENYRGAVSWNVQLKLDAFTLKNINSNVEVAVFAVEMVYIPEGSFFIGDTDPDALNYASFFEVSANKSPAGPYKITSEDQTITVGGSEGDLYYETGNSPYRGDNSGIIPASFPKGYNAFYMMKYETSQGLYADFLNTISSELAAKLTPHKTKEYYEKRGSIKFEANRYVAESRNRPANYITWDDGAALADWAGLRPMTELEFTKAARGPNKPFTHEFPWGTSSTEELKRKVTLDDELTLVDETLEGDLKDSNRQVYGASYYWVMDLAGSLWEKCVTIGDEIGRNYLGTHGDGKISETGTATNQDWPVGIAEEGGYGYRGGGYYNHGMKITDYNPHSPISYRPYGSWAGGKRSIAYSQRYVRTAD